MLGGGIAMLAMACVLASPLAKIFVGYDEGLFVLTKQALSIYAFAFILYGVNVFASSFFTALNNGGVSAAISFMRTLVFQTAAVLLLPLLIGLGACNGGFSGICSGKGKTVSLFGLDFVFRASKFPFYHPKRQRCRCEICNWPGIHDAINSRINRQDGNKGHKEEDLLC